MKYMNTLLQALSRYFWPTCSGLLAAIIVILILENHKASENLNEKSFSFNPVNPGSFSQAVDKAAPAVVNIYTSKTVIQHTHPLFNDPFARRFFGLQSSPSERVQTGLGSGVIMNRDGYILTNHHVIQGADEILVELNDKRQSRAQVIGIDAETDLAVLKITLEKIPFMEAISTQYQVGDIALAIGNPLGIGQTVTMGIISATGRNNLGLNTYENFIQTDAAINRGNSGGALIDTSGHLVGINSVIFSKSGGSDGIGFAIPAQLAAEVLQNIINDGRVIRGWLGATFQKLTPELANYLKTQQNTGVVITRVLPDGPASEANIMVGDLIIEIDGQEITNDNDALSAIAKTRPGSSTNLTIIRKSEVIKLTAIVAERPQKY
jgi:serine protease DegS